MLLIDYILLAAAVIYFAEMVFLHLGLQKTRRYARNPSFEPLVSVIVAARNEEDNIGECLQSLVELDYPSDKLEFIVVNDRSTDGTEKVASDFVHRFPNVKLVTSKPERGNMRGKANALAHGIAKSRGEILMFTDADCTVPRPWIRRTVSYYADDVGVVAGFTYLQTRGSFDGMQALDWFFLFGVAAATAAWNIPLTAVGNNLSVRRSAYDAVGGYEKIPFSVTEDYALVQSIWQRTRLQIRYPMVAETLITSKPCHTWQQLFGQRQRWGVGGLDMVLRGFLIMAVAFALHLLIILGLFLATPWTIAAALFVKLGADVFFLWKPLKEFERLRLLRYFPMFEIYYMIYGLLIPFIALLSKRVVWKERAFREQ